VQAQRETTWTDLQGVVHTGELLETVNSFEVIECEHCRFKHVIPIPTVDELVSIYSHEYYSTEKPLYIDRYKDDLEWWNTVYTHRYEIFERHLPRSQRMLLDIGSGPGYFILNGKSRGWKVKGVEPSVQAAQHSQQLGLDVENIFFSEHSAPALGQFDAINMGEVLEHIPQPAEFLTLIHARLNHNGMVCLVVPNDFNPIQLTLRDHLGFDAWWVAPPHHINYFDFKSLTSLVERCGFEVVLQESTFPIDIFLLMGDNYVGNEKLGRECHIKRMNFEKNIIKGGRLDLLNRMFASFANQGLGREIVMFIRKKC